MTTTYRRRAGSIALTAALAAGVSGILAPPASAVTVVSTVLVNAGTNTEPVVSANPEAVAFVTTAKLLGADTDNQPDVYLRDLATGGLELISQNTVAPAEHPAISADGRFVAFDLNSTIVFRHDRQTGETVQVSRGRVNSVETIANGLSRAPSISANGNRIAFESTATNLVDGDTNGRKDVFVRDVLANFTFRASVRIDEGQAIGGDSLDAAISGDGNHVAFTSGATNLAIGDTNGVNDVFVRNTVDGSTRWASQPVNADGGGPAGEPAINQNGQLVVFRSISDLVIGGSELICQGQFDGDTPDVFLFRVTGSPKLSVVSGPGGGHDVTDLATEPTISGAGSRIGFESTPFEVTGCPNPHPDPNDPEPPTFVEEIGDPRIMLRDGTTTTRIDQGSSGFANGPSTNPAISAGGDAVAYLSAATNLAGGAATAKVFLTTVQ